MYDSIDFALDVSSLRTATTGKQVYDTFEVSLANAVLKQIKNSRQSDGVSAIAMEPKLASVDETNGPSTEVPHNKRFQQLDSVIRVELLSFPFCR